MRRYNSSEALPNIFSPIQVPSMIVGSTSGSERFQRDQITEPIDNQRHGPCENEV